MKLHQKLLLIVSVACLWYGLGMAGVRIIAGQETEMKVSKAEYYGFAMLGPINLMIAGFKSVENTFTRLAETHNECVLNCGKSEAEYYARNGVMICEKPIRNPDGTQDLTCFGDINQDVKPLLESSCGEYEPKIVGDINLDTCAGKDGITNERCKLYTFTCK